MKKLYFFAIIISIGSCKHDSLSNNSDELKLNSKNDSVSLKLESNNDSVSYSLGVNIGENLQKEFPNIDLHDLENGIKDVFDTSKSPSIQGPDAQKIIQDYFAKQQAAASQEIIKVGEDFLAKNGKRDGVITTESGLQYEILKVGDGPKPSATDNVKTHYHGTLLDGTVFDSSVDRGEPISFNVNGVIAGWTEALQLMTVGSKWRLYIPYNLAYGERGAGSKIGPYSTLIFEVELLNIN
ncbi:MAG: peptidylprolyl isomerase [Crocinitomicaceae bacterium]|nr:peptidylprolyl isomerase [Crocinitomicaceae bacterium]|tara:strand:- start:1525 stop:2241 length:717 start_codon:yes stop_codon:yes gene_type:complete